jgi:hypothetical protein
MGNIGAIRNAEHVQLLKVIDHIIEYARKEDGVLRYVVGLPIDDKNQTSIYLIEECVVIRPINSISAADAQPLDMRPRKSDKPISPVIQ